MQSLPSEFVQGRRTDGGAVRDIIIHRQQRDGEGNYRIATVHGFKRFRLGKIIGREMQAFPLKPCQFGSAKRNTVGDIVRLRLFPCDADTHR